MSVRAVNKRRRALSMTSLIDVIFLLLLFFMLTSTFTRFAELPLHAATGGAASASDAAPFFISLGMQELRLNGEVVALDALAGAIDARSDGTASVLVSAADGVTSQRLVDLLVAIGTLPDLSVTVLE
jgi:biopolymer transport protein ExbD